MPDNEQTESDKKKEEDELFERVFQLFLPPIKQKIRMRAEDVAKEDQRDSLAAKDVMQACQEYMPGLPFVPIKPKWAWTNQNITGFMAITAVMTIIFGVLGIVPGVKEGANFLEIAKIFAGALVGGAAGAAATARRP